MDERDKYVVVYKEGLDFLKAMTPPEVNLESFFQGKSRNYKTVDDIFEQFISSAQNYQHMKNVIAYEKRKDVINDMLDGLDHKKVSKKDPEELYRSFRKKFEIKSADNNHNSWRKWSYAVVDSAKFLMEFQTTSDFEEFVERFGYNVHTSMALPLLISHKISGIGFALACDLLKELGFTRYSKPDVHLMEVFSQLGLSENNQISTFEAMVRMADYCKEIDKTVTPYKVDKVFWLICSGKFKDKKKGMKKEFIDLMRAKMV